MKLIVTPSSKEQLDKILLKKIDGVIIYLDKLSVNSSFYMSLDLALKYDFKDKEVFLCMNKIMHNNDLSKVRDSLLKIKNTNYKILFYDMGIFNIAKEFDIVNKLFIYQDHLNASSLSNKFYFDLGISGSYITSDITKDEVLNIKNNNNGYIMMNVYGYLPIFYSRRYLITNYLKYIDVSMKEGKYKIISDDGESYPIVEEEFGTTVYSSKPLNLLNKKDKFSNIDYCVMDGNLISDESFLSLLDDFILGRIVHDGYLGFYNTKTIYRVKGE